MSRPIVAIFFLTLIISSYTTEVIGIHALFGAFMAGAIMPDNTKFRSIFIEKVEDVSLVLLLPLFFVFTGLRTEIGLLNDPYLWKVTGLIILIAIVGKFIGSAIAAKFVGQSWKDSLMIGALMNTRGLMELVVLNIGYDLGVLTPEIFAMMVIMALVTTFMTAPVLDLTNRVFKARQIDIPHEISKTSKFRILISFGNPECGRTLLRLAHSIIRNAGKNASVTAMHLSPSSELHYYNVAEYEKKSFAPIIEESEALHQKFTTLFKASSDIDTDITEVANQGDYDLLIIGLGQSIYEGSLLGKFLGFTTRIINPEKFLSQMTGKESLFELSPFDERIQNILNKSSVQVGVFIDKNFTDAENVLIPIFSEGDISLLPFIQKLINNSGSQITILDSDDQIKNNTFLKEKIRAIEQNAHNHINILREMDINNDFLIHQNLMIVSIKSWKRLIELKSTWLSDIPSTLILKESD